MKSDAVATSVFVDFFRENIRVLLDWERIAREEFPISVEVVSTRDDIAPWYLPWYVGEGGSELDHSVDNASPVVLSRLTETIVSLKPERRQFIFYLAEEFEKQPQPIQLVIPTYSASGRTIVLDGNHRLAALQVATVRFKILKFSISGPADPTILPDLSHWTDLDQPLARRRQL